ncbi:caspase domain-containing protein [Crepidotus variabilis]|uniref:Caspase domain-containing protein n=1 Tax=Crepidotus variabilis TaxID=179855 RepID=A0A9P6EIQ1_9AGAR|nr:caspase domain-containing protein [Crepidotus variabilis]
MFALIIGIDLYGDQRIDNLQGAVNDARAMKEYLEQDLGVPPDRIIYLKNELATREAIFKAFKEFRNLPALVSGSPVLIYFAGHGVRVIDNDVKEAMEAIIPYDCDGFWSGNIHPILDKTISSLVESIYNKVGNNITFISDCCHSGSMTRGGEPNIRGVHVPLSYLYPTNLDIEHIYEALPYGSDAPSEQTHVLLAACGAKELAREAFSANKWHGEFTRALLHLLKSTSIYRLTPDDILFRLANGAVSHQSPQCRGQNSSRYFFTGGAPLRWYRVAYNASEHIYELNGGLSHGISEGAVFRIFSDRNANQFIGLATATRIKPFQSSLKPDHPVTQEGFALLYRVGDFVRPTVFIDEQLQGSHPISRALDVVSRQEECLYPTRAKHRQSCLLLREEVDGTVTLANLDNLLSFPHSPHYLSTYIPAYDHKIRNILAHVAQFFYHLRNVSPEADQAFGIGLEFLKVAEVIRAPKSRLRYLPPGENLLQAGTVSVIASKTAQYGFRLKNNSDRDWFVTVLYFDGAQHTIVEGFTKRIVLSLEREN